MQYPHHYLPGVAGPLAGAPGQGRIRAGYLFGVASAVRKLGGDPLRVLEHQHIDPQLFDDPDQDIDCVDAVNLLEYCSKSLDDPLFGLHVAEQQDPDAFGCVIALARAAPDLGTALQSLVDYVPFSTSPECEMELLRARDVVELRWRTHLEMGDKRQVNYHGLMMIMKTLQMLGRQHFRPRYASLAIAVGRPEILALQERLGCRVQARASANAIAFDADILGRPLATSNRMLFGLLENGMAQLRAATRADFQQLVEASVRRALAAGCCTVDGCAEELGTSARTLQKRLSRVGVKFLDIVQAERIKLAKHALLWSDCSLDEIAFRLGYSEQTSFGRAFKRSTGMTPKAFRISEQQGH